MVVEQQFISADKFLEMAAQPEYHDRVIELVEGVIVEMPFPNPVHAAILALLTSRITVFVHESGIGQVVAGDAPFILERNLHGRDSVRGLDIAFIAQERMPKPIPSQPFAIAPDLAVEIVSPSNTALDIHLKILQLLNAGTALIWIVYPDSRTVAVHTADGAITRHEHDTLSGGDVLPGFEIRVGDIFPH